MKIEGSNNTFYHWGGQKMKGVNFFENYFNKNKTIIILFGGWTKIKGAEIEGVQNQWSEVGMGYVVCPRGPST